jgi:hypothetical protein
MGGKTQAGGRDPMSERLSVHLHSVNSEDVYRGAAELGVELDEHIAFVVRALTGVAGEIGLAAG